jgi:hypothetical protein
VYEFPDGLIKSNNTYNKLRGLSPQANYTDRVTAASNNTYNKLHGLSPQANYTDRVTAASNNTYRPSDGRFKQHL